VFTAIGGLQVSSSGTLRGLVIEGNVGFAGSGVSYEQMSINSVVNEGFITNNSNFEIVVSGANSSSISGNIGLNCDMSLSGDFNSNIVSGNFVKNMTLDGAFVGIACDNNFIDGDLTLDVSGSLGSFSGNIVTGGITLWSSGASRTLEKIQISGNNVSSNLLICDTHGVGTTSSLTNSKILGNIVGGSIKLLDNAGTTSSMSFTGNEISNNVFSGMTMKSSSIVHTYSDLRVCGNTMSGSCSMTISENPVNDFSNFMFCDNIMSSTASNFELLYSGSSVISLALNGWIMSGNKMRAIAFLPDAGTGAASTLTMKATNITNNSFSGLTASAASKDYEPGIYVSKGKNTGTVTVENCSFSGNFYGGTSSSPPTTYIEFKNSASGNFVLNNSEVCGNRGCDLWLHSTTGDLAIQELNVSGNVFNKIGLSTEGINIACNSGNIDRLTVNGNQGGTIIVVGDELQRIQIVSNRLDSGSTGLLRVYGTTTNNSIISQNYLGSDMELTGQLLISNISNNNVSGNITLSALTDITHLNFSGNYVGNTVELPGIAVFGFGSEQSKFIGNFASTWTSSGSIDTAGSGKGIFPWGNTSATTSSTVTFSGTTATDVSTANKVGASGGGITN
jgi:hypothetical protein